MKRREFIALAGAAAVFPRVALGQQAAKVPRVAFFHLGATQVQIDAFLRGMRERGYLPGKDFSWEVFETPSSADLPRVGAAAISSRPDVLLTQGPSAFEAKAQTSTIPIVFAIVGSAVEGGLIASYAHPGGNATGVPQVEVGGNRLELLREIIPDLRRLAVFILPGDPSPELNLPNIIADAKRIGVDITRVDVLPDSDLEPLYASAVAAGAQALQFNGVNTFLPRLQRFADLALKYKLPTMFNNRRLPAAGGLVSYGPDANAAFYRAASYVVDILKGARPGDLPVEAPREFELVINLKTAKALGITIPQSILYQATEIIE